MNNKLGHESAFPIRETRDTESIELGLSKREYIAAKAMEALINAQFSNLPESIENKYFFEKEQLIEAAFSYADEFFKQEVL